RTVRLHDGGVAVGPLEIQPRDGVGGDSRELAFQVGKAREHANADPAAARFVAGEGGSIEQTDGDPAGCEGASRRRGGRSRAEDDNGVGRRRYGDHWWNSGKRAQTCAEGAL